MTNYLENFSHLAENQYGFRKKETSIQAATSLYKNRRKLGIQSQNTLHFFDFGKAFDSVDHNILLEKLYQIGIRGMANRLQYVKIENECSKLRSKQRGVPQGSFRDPLLFLLYINGLGADENWQSEFINYADDTVMTEKLNIFSKVVE